MASDRWVGWALSIGLAFGVVWLAFGFATTDVYSADLWREHSYWPLVYLCAAAGLVGIFLLCVVERTVAALLLPIGIFALLAFGPAAVICTAAVGWAAYILGEMIVRRAPEGGGDPPAFWERCFEDGNPTLVVRLTSSIKAIAQTFQRAFRHNGVSVVHRQ